MATASEQQGRLDPTVAAASPSGWRRWLLRVGHDEPHRAVAFGIVLGGGFLTGAAALYAFAWLANEVLDQETTRIDGAALLFLRAWASPMLDAVATGISLFGSELVFVFGVLLLILFGWQRRWGAAAALILIAGGAQILNDILKATFHRTRPEPVAGFIQAQQFSFPSGHAMESAAFYGFLAYLVWRLTRGAVRAMAVTGLALLVIAIGISRIYLQDHFLSDVIAGYMAGFIWTDAVIIGGLILRPKRRS
jgi:membrane-associated phospholipid phosphatase